MPNSIPSAIPVITSLIGSGFSLSGAGGWVAAIAAILGAIVFIWKQFKGSPEQAQQSDLQNVDNQIDQEQTRKPPQ